MAPLLAPGALAPSIEALDQQGRTFRLADQRGRWVVLYFYPKDETRHCTQEACGFRDLHGEFQGEGAVVVGVSRDTAESHQRFAKHRRLSFPLLADPPADIIRSYGARRWYGWARRCTYLIDPQGHIAKTYGGVRAKAHPRQVLDDLRVLKGRVRAAENPPS